MACAPVARLRFHHPPSSFSSQWTITTKYDLVSASLCLLRLTPFLSPQFGNYIGAELDSENDSDQEQQQEEPQQESRPMHAYDEEEEEEAGGAGGLVEGMMDVDGQLGFVVFFSSFRGPTGGAVTRLGEHHGLMWTVIDIDSLGIQGEVEGMG